MGDGTTIKLLNVREVAQALGLHPRTVWSLTRQAEAGISDFPRPLRLAPHTVRWRLCDLERYLATLAARKVS